MPEDAPGNPGAVPEWADEESGEPDDELVMLGKVRGMQDKLHRWAGEDQSRRFGDLFNLVCDPDFLAEAWFRVKANAGARTPGIDKATVADIENRTGVGVFLDQIRDSLKSGEFRPVEVRRVLIPKKSGKLRKLGIPSASTASSARGRRSSGRPVISSTAGTLPKPAQPTFDHAP